MIKRLKEGYTHCVVCGKKLKGNQKVYCSNKCKMVIKNERKKGKRCRLCYKPMRPVPVMGGFKQEHDSCLKKLNQRSK